MRNINDRKVWLFAALLVTLAWCGRDGVRTALASGIAAVSSVFGQVGAVNIPVTTTDISTPSNPASGKTTWYTKSGTLCSLSPGGSEVCTNAGGTVDNNTVKNAVFISDTSMSANAITGTTTTTFPGSYATGQQVIVLLANTVTGATTININSLGSKNVTKNGTTALAANDLVAGGIYLLTYDGTEFVLTQNLPAGGGSGATVSLGAFASAPSCTSSPFIYLANNAGVVGYCNGSSTLTWKYGPLLVKPTTTGATSWFNQTGASIAADTATEGVVLTGTAGGGNNVQARLMAVPATPYTQIGCFNQYASLSPFNSLGILLTDGTNVSTSKIITSEALFSNGAPSGLQLAIAKQTGATGGTASYTLTPTFPPAFSNPVCFAVQDDGTTNRKWAISYDRQNWDVVLTTTRTDFLTAADVGFFVNTGTSNVIPIMHLFSWETVASTLF